LHVDDNLVWTTGGHRQIHKHEALGDAIGVPWKSFLRQDAVYFFMAICTQI
jgi:hypothetical protein